MAKTKTKPELAVAACETVTFAEVDASLAAMGGLAGLPLLIATVSRFMPGGVSIPPEWTDWLGKRIAERTPFSVTFEQGGRVWRLNIK